MLRVVIADDSLLIRQGLAAVVDALDDVECVGQATNVVTLDRLVDELGPDVVVTDIRMPPTHTDEGIAAALRIRATRPDVGVVVLSQYAEPAFVLQLFAEGSDGLAYLLKDRIGPGDLGRAVHAVATGGSSVDPRIVEVLVDTRTRRPSPLDALTPREREVLASIAGGRNNAGVAQELVLSERAVAKHINAIFSKLDLGDEEGTHRRVRAVLTWLAETG